MGGCCSKCRHHLHGDTQQFPVQCEDAGENRVATTGDIAGLADDFIGWRQDVFPVQCTDPPPLHELASLSSTSKATLVVCIDTVQWEFHAPVHRHQGHFCCI